VLIADVCRTIARACLQLVKAAMLSACLQQEMPANKQSQQNWFIALALVALTTTAYWETKDHSFVSYDDDVYVVTNPHVQSGLTLRNVAWAFTSTSAANWHPLTWLSHMLDVQLFGANPAGHHLTSLLIHLANVLLLFWVLHVMTGAVWRSALVAALFAVHPINVESVAWVAERKNLLSTFFWLLTMWAYVRYARRPARNTYLVVFASFALALMSKPMAVTLPFALMLVDYWPLDRLRSGATGGASEKSVNSKTRSKRPEARHNCPRRSVGQLAMEKAPLLLLAILSSVITVKAQQAGNAVGTTGSFPLSVRFENALVSYARYLLDVVWPFRLAVFYPHPRAAVSTLQVVLSALVLLGISAIVLWRAKRFAYLPVGWLWYLGTLIPVIGMVQVGLQSRADRYAYVPLIGIFVFIVWSAAESTKGRRTLVKPLAIGAVCILVALTIATRVQSGYWQNSITLFQRALAVTDNNYVAHNNLGELLARQDKLDEAEAQFAAALTINPSFALARHNLGMTLVQRGKPGEAILEFSKAVEMDPAFTDAYNKLGAALANQGRLDEAITNFSKAIEINPSYASAHANLGSAYEQLGRIAEAIAAYSRALTFTADTTMAAQTHFRLGRLLAKTGKRNEAIQHYREAVRLKPDYAQAQQALNSLFDDMNQSVPIH
jgi:Flp pilus assembly protein TadD